MMSTVGAHTHVLKNTMSPAGTQPLVPMPSCLQQGRHHARHSRFLLSPVSVMQAYLGSDGTDIAWDFLRAANASVAMTCVTLLQDVMRLDNSARMNRPGQAAGNWAWRVGDSDIWEKLAPEAEELKKLAFIYNRLPKDAHVEY